MSLLRPLSKTLLLSHLTRSALRSALHLDYTSQSTNLKSLGHDLPHQMTGSSVGRPRMARCFSTSTMANDLNSEGSGSAQSSSQNPSTALVVLYTIHPYRILGKLTLRAGLKVFHDAIWSGRSHGPGCDNARMSWSGSFCSSCSPKSHSGEMDQTSSTRLQLLACSFAAGHPRIAQRTCPCPRGEDAFYPEQKDKNRYATTVL